MGLALYLGSLSTTDTYPKPAFKHRDPFPPWGFPHITLAACLSAPVHQYPSQWFRGLVKRIPASPVVHEVGGAVVLCEHVCVSLL